MRIGAEVALDSCNVTALEVEEQDRICYERPTARSLTNMALSTIMQAQQLHVLALESGTDGLAVPHTPEG